MTSNLTNLANYAADSIGVNDSGETLSTQQLSDMLDLSNKILDNWSSQEIMIPIAVTTASLPLSSGIASYVVGTGQTWAVTPAPLKIVTAALVMANGVTIGVEVVDAARWAAIPDRGNKSDWIKYLFYTPTSFASTKLGTAYVSPIPAGAGGTITIQAWVPFTQFADTTTAITIPDGYLLALQWTLAKRMTSYFDVPWSQDNEAMLESAVTAVRTLNAQMWGLIAQGAPVAAAPAQ
jgi:hypothetical protein